MNHTLPRFLLIGLLAGVTSSAMAQTDLSYLFTSRPKNYFSAGINIRTGGPSVKFSHLGSLPRSLFDPTQGAAGENVYDDGMVGVDIKRADETATSTTQVVYNADKSRYQVKDTTTGLVYSDELAYNAAQTRIWSANNASQIHDGYVDMHFTTAKEAGGTGEGPGKSSGGFDLQLARDIGLIGKRASWGISFSFGMNDINSQTSKQVASNAYLYTGRYTLNGTVPTGEVGTAPYYSAPSPSGVASNGGGVEDTVTLSPAALGLATTPDANGKSAPVAPTIDTSTYTGVASSTGSNSFSNTAAYSEVRMYPGQATVTGTWKIKGAYYLMRLGPSFRYYVSKHVSLSGNVGVAAAYVGSDFTIDETMTAPTVKSTSGVQPRYVALSHQREFKIGGFAEANAEYWITFRTGLFGGLVYDTLGHYNHKLDDAVAQVDIGSGLSFHVGVITRF